ncbi:MAG: ATP-binding cassette domain-containing protein [Pseudomonadota bacterium]|nr:ATP-binding cassette domain-containing protein [Pseudomonadota bacterium]
MKKVRILRMLENLSSKEAVLAANNVSKQVSSPEGTLTILSEVSFAIDRGDSVAVVGASGAGKSTLLALLAGLDLPTSGEIWLDSNNLTNLDEDGRAAVRAASVGFVFQSFHLVPSLNALENVMLPLELAGKSEPRKAADEIMQKVGLGERWSHYPSQLSGGEKQRVAIARAFATEPAVLFADEPTGNLDSHTGDNVVELMFELNHTSSTTLVLVTHDQALANRCNRILGLDAGRLVTDKRAAV